MEKLQLTQVPVATTGMLIRRPAAAVTVEALELNLTGDRYPKGVEGH